MTQKFTTTTPQDQFDPKSIIFLIILLTIMAALTGCRNSQAVTETAQAESTTAQSSEQAHSVRLDSFFTQLALTADTFDIEFTTTLLPEVTVTADSGRKQTSWHLHAVGLHSNSTSANISQSTIQCSQSNRSDSTANSTSATESRKSTPLLGFQCGILLLTLLAIILAIWRLYPIIKRILLRS